MDSPAAWLTHELPCPQPFPSDGLGSRAVPSLCSVSPAHTLLFGGSSLTGWGQLGLRNSLPT